MGEVRVPTVPSRHLASKGPLVFLVSLPAFSPPLCGFHSEDLTSIPSRSRRDSVILLFSGHGRISQALSLRVIVLPGRSLCLSLRRLWLPILGKMAEFLLLTRGHGDGRRVFDILREGQTILKCCRRACGGHKMHFQAVKLSPLIEITDHGGFVLPGCLTRSSR